MANGDNGNRIPEPVVADGADTVIRFSFKHIHLQSNEFGPTCCGEEYLRSLVEKLHFYSRCPLDEFLNMNNEEHRHTINFSETRFPDGFPNVNLDQLAYHEAWQFAIRNDRPWRVYGIVIGDTFFVIWLDPNHRLYQA